jgi:hypothetical protein
MIAIANYNLSPFHLEIQYSFHYMCYLMVTSPIMFVTLKHYSQYAGHGLLISVPGCTGTIMTTLGLMG